MKKVSVLVALVLGVTVAYAGTATYDPATFLNSQALGAQGPVAIIGTPGESVFSASADSFYVFGDGQFKYALADESGAALRFDPTDDYSIEWTQHVDPIADVAAELGSTPADQAHYNYLGPGLRDGGIAGDPTATENDKLTLGVEYVNPDYKVKIHNHGFAVFLPPYTEVTLDPTQAHDLAMRVTFTVGTGNYKYEVDTGAKAYQTVLDGAWGSLAGGFLVGGGDFVVGRSSRSTALAANGNFGTIVVSGDTVPTLNGAFGLPSMKVPFFESK